MNKPVPASPAQISDEQAVKAVYPHAYAEANDCGGYNVYATSCGTAKMLGTADVYEIFAWSDARSRLEPVEAATLREKMSDEDFVKQKYPDASQWAFGTYHDGEPFYRVYDTPHIKTSSNLLGHGWAEAARIIREIEPVEAVPQQELGPFAEGPGSYEELSYRDYLIDKAKAALPQQEDLVEKWMRIASAKAMELDVARTTIFRAYDHANAGHPTDAEELLERYINENP